jgi:DNA repair protein RadC
MRVVQFHHLENLCYNAPIPSFDTAISMSDHPALPPHTTNVELVAALLDSENALNMAALILVHFDGLHGLRHATAKDLQKIEALSTSSTLRILAALEIANRLMTYRADERPILTSAADAVYLVSDMANLQQEQVRVILLDLSQRVVDISTIYIGTLNASVLRTAEVFREAIIRNCPAVILVHNHPSGDSSPSPEDVELTRILIAAGKLLDITLIDHLIISRHGWSSLKEMGLAFNQPS